MSVAQQGKPSASAPSAAPPPRRRPLAAILAALVVVLALGAAALWIAADRIAGWPFDSTETIDRSGPAVLLTLTDLAEHRAATGRFQVIVDLERDVPVVPRQIAGERVLFVAQGSVDATVDFAELGPETVEVSEDRTRVEVQLPRARLSEPTVDPEDSYVFERSRGLLDRLGSVFADNPSAERELYLAAEERLAEAAAESDLLEAAERNTTSMLTGLLGSLGFTDVEVAYR